MYYYPSVLLSSLSFSLSFFFLHNFTAASQSNIFFLFCYHTFLSWLFYCTRRSVPVKCKLRLEVKFVIICLGTIFFQQTWLCGRCSRAIVFRSIVSIRGGVSVTTLVPSFHNYRSVEISLYIKFHIARNRI